ncbi:MAG: DUF3307 domain-containing protein [Chloroflexota bacterium]
MSADPVLVVSWLVLAHLAADFLFQTGPMVRDKSAGGIRAIQGLLRHGLVVAACLVPVGLAFGGPGWLALIVIALSHVAIDRGKTVLTQRAETAAIADARRRHAPEGDEAESLGPAWTPVPAGLFALDQLVHLAVTLATWAVLLATTPVWDGFGAAVDLLARRWDPALFHAAVLVAVVALDLLIVNVRAGALFVATLVEPRLAIDHEGHPSTTPERAGSAPPERVGEAIGILERLVIVVLMLTGAEAAIGLVIAAKTIARFRQLDDRDFAEYYLLGTLGSVAVAVSSALVASAALATLP